MDYKLGPRGHRTVGSLPIVLTEVGSSTFGYSKSTGGILSRLPRGWTRIGSQIGRQTANTSPIDRNAATGACTLSLRLAERAWSVRLAHLDIIRAGRPTTRSFCFRHQQQG